METRQRKLEYLRSKPWGRRFINELMKDYYSEDVESISILHALKPDILAYVSWKRDGNFWRNLFDETRTALKEIENGQISSN